ncbi:membrane protein [Rhodococcus rhodochrous]|nr:membrane protein [Rhodococcus rhodochrous]
MNFDLQDLSGTFTTFDIIVSLSLSFVLASIIGWVYRHTHTNVSYSQSYVQTLVLVGMVISLIMLVVGSNIARAFALVGALSVVRFRNAIKETRDVGFIFLVMAVGMTTGTRFYLLAIAATIAICLVLLIMNKFNWFKLDVQRQVVKVQVPPEQEYSAVVEDVLIQYCSEFELVSTESVRSGALTELYYTAQLKKGKKPNELISALSAVNTGQRVTVLTGYDQTDI